jgi:hypothetical protein
MFEHLIAISSKNEAEKQLDVAAFFAQGLVAKPRAKPRQMSCLPFKNLYETMV